MQMFEYKGHDARAETITAFELARYSQLKALNALDTLGSAFVPAIAAGSTAPAGWRDLTPQELGLSASTQDGSGNYIGATSTSPQARILGHFDANGTVNQISVSFAGTSDLGDVPDYFKIVGGAYMEEYRYLLDATAQYSLSHGLTGSDVIVTGYSLGGAATNILAEYSHSYANGFFDTADYFGFSSPNIYDDPSKILNFGAENDTVYRSIGDHDDTTADFVTEALIHKDRPFESTADNVVLFNDFYASPLSPFGPSSLLNLPGGWNAHVTGIFDPAVITIGRSHFYDQMDRDSAVIITELSDALRPITWVGDVPRITSSHYGDPAFILGSDSADKLMDGQRDDFLDGFGGDDRFRVSTGNDTVNGGDGSDTVEFQGKPSDYEVMRLSDGTIFLNDRTGHYGLDELASVEHLQIGLASYDVQTGKLAATSPFTASIAYTAVREGTAGADTLTGTGGNDRLFGLAGDDRIDGGAGNDLIHGGAGNDTLIGGAGDDLLFGAAGNDRLTGGRGNDVLSGGTGNDVFDFSGGVLGADKITDFNAGSNEHDVLLFGSNVFHTAEEALAAFHQVGDDVVLNLASGSITLASTHLADLTVHDIMIA